MTIRYFSYEKCNNIYRSLSLPTLPKYTVGSVPGQCLHVHIRVTFLLLQNATIAMVVGDAIYLFGPSPI